MIGIGEKRSIGKAYAIALPLFLFSFIFGAALAMPDNQPAAPHIIGIMLLCCGIAWGPAAGYFYGGFKTYALASGIIKTLIIGGHLSFSLFILHGESDGIDRIVFVASIYYSIPELIALGVAIKSTREGV